MKGLFYLPPSPEKITINLDNYEQFVDLSKINLKTGYNEEIAPIA